MCLSVLSFSLYRRLCLNAVTSGLSHVRGWGNGVQNKGWFIFSFFQGHVGTLAGCGLEVLAFQTFALKSEPALKDKIVTLLQK